jgi:hypothetical protein
MDQQIANLTLLNVLREAIIQDQGLGKSPFGEVLEACGFVLREDVHTEQSWKDGPSEQWAYERDLPSSELLERVKKTIAPWLATPWRCSFCDKPQAQVKALVAEKHKAAICDECVLDAMTVLQKEGEQPAHSEYVQDMTKVYDLLGKLIKRMTLRVVKDDVK